jgi:hypothetical protein
MEVEITQMKRMISFSSIKIGLLTIGLASAISLPCMVYTTL